MLLFTTNQNHQKKNEPVHFHVVGDRGEEERRGEKRRSRPRSKANGKRATPHDLQVNPKNTNRESGVLSYKGGVQKNREKTGVRTARTAPMRGQEGKMSDVDLDLWVWFRQTKREATTERNERRSSTEGWRSCWWQLVIMGRAIASIIPSMV